jgi:hypothetical protein
MSTARLSPITCIGLRPALFAAATALAILLSACGGSDDPAPPPAAPPAAVAPTITTPPAAATVTEGQSASFTVVAAGTAPLSYAWRRNGSTIAGATAATYTLAAATLADNAATFSVVVSNGAGSVTSGAAVLTVNALTVVPTITTQPAAATLSAGGSTTFTVAVGGTPTPTVQWLIAGGADLADGAGSGALAGATVAGATTTTLTLTNVPQTANGLQLAARATNSAGTITSANAALTINAAGIAIAAAAGGTATSPDGKLRAIFPPNAFTADTVVTFTPVAAPALPSGTEPFAEDFASFQPVAGGFYRLDFTGGLLKPDVEVEYGLRSAALVVLQSAQQVRPLSPPPGNPPRATVIRCSDGSSQVYMGSPGADYDTVRAILCGGDPSRNVTVGPAVVIPPPSASLQVRNLARTGIDTLRKVISFSNGRSAFGFEGQQEIGNSVNNVSGLGIVAANGSISTAIANATLVGFDGNGQVLGQLSGCRLAAFGQRVSSLLGAFIFPTPTWTVQLAVGPAPFNSCLGVPTAAAPGPGGTWVVANGNNLDRYSAAGVATPVLRPAGFPQSDIRRQITYRRLAVDSAGNIWGLGELNSSNFFDCPGSSSGPCPALVKLDPSGAVLGQVQLGSALATRVGELTPMALTLDAAGDAYTARPVAGFAIVVSRVASSGTAISWAAQLSNTLGGSQALGEIAVNSTTGEVFAGTAPRGVVYRLDANGVETGVRTVGAPFARSVINGLSINPTGTLTYIGDLSGTLDGATSASCIGETRPCVDIFLRRFDF